MCTASLIASHLCVFSCAPPVVSISTISQLSLSCLPHHCNTTQYLYTYHIAHTALAPRIFASERLYHKCILLTLSPRCLVSPLLLPLPLRNALLHGIASQRVFGTCYRSAFLYDSTLAPRRICGIASPQRYSFLHRYPPIQLCVKSSVSDEEGTLYHWLHDPRLYTPRVAMAHLLHTMRPAMLGMHKDRRAIDDVKHRLFACHVLIQHAHASMCTFQTLTPLCG